MGTGNKKKEQKKTLYELFFWKALFSACTIYWKSVAERKIFENSFSWFAPEIVWFDIMIYCAQRYAVSQKIKYKSIINYDWFLINKKKSICN